MFTCALHQDRKIYSIYFLKVSNFSQHICINGSPERLLRSCFCPWCWIYRGAAASSFCTSNPAALWPSRASRSEACSLQGGEEQMLGKSLKLFVFNMFNNANKRTERRFVVNQSTDQMKDSALCSLQWLSVHTSVRKRQFSCELPTGHFFLSTFPTTFKHVLQHIRLDRTALSLLGFTLLLAPNPSAFLPAFFGKSNTADQTVGNETT